MSEAIKFPTGELPDLNSEIGTPIHVGKLLRIDSGNLMREFETHAKWQGFIGFQHAEAKLAVGYMESDIARKEAEKYLYLKENFEKIYNYKPTVESIKAAVAVDAEVVKLEDKLRILKRRSDFLDVLRQAFLAKKDMLVSLGAHERSERNLSPTS